MNCPYCNEPMRYDERNYWVCGRCLGEFWPGELQKERGEYQARRYVILNSLAAQTTALNSKPVLPPGVPHFKGGNKNGKKHKKKIKNVKKLLEI